MPLRVALADDEPIARNRLERLLKDAGCDVVGSFEDGATLLSWLQDTPEVDALFLDILMPGPSGMEVMAELEHGLPVVFVTANPSHAVSAFEAQALDYLVKPVTPERLAKTLARIQPAPHRASHAAPAATPGRIPVRAGEGKLLLEIRRTTHFEVENQVVFAWAGGKRYRTTWTSLAEAEAAMPGIDFLRIQRHQMLRPESVIGMRSLPTGQRLVTLPDGLELEVSRSAAQELRAKLGL